MLIYKIFNRIVFLVFKIVLSPLRGKKQFQPLYYNIHNLSLLGINYGYADMLINGEYRILNILKNSININEEIVIFDVGANIGNYSKMIIDQLANISYQLYSFEPSKETYLVLEQNLRGSSAKLYNIGFGKEINEQILFSDSHLSGLASLSNRRLEHFNINFKNTEIIKLTTLDEFCKDKNITKIDFLKLDVEGHELNVLKGAKLLLENRAIKIIQFEMGGANIDSRTFFQDFWYLLSGKYKIYRIIKNGLIEVKGYEESLEIFKNINFLAIQVNSIYTE